MDRDIDLVSIIGFTGEEISLTWKYHPQRHLKCWSCLLWVLLWFLYPTRRHSFVEIMKIELNCSWLNIKDSNWCSTSSSSLLRMSFDIVNPIFTVEKDSKVWLDLWFFHNLISYLNVMTHYLFRDDLIHVSHGHGSSSYFCPSILSISLPLIRIISFASFSPSLDATSSRITTITQSSSLLSTYPLMISHTDLNDIFTIEIMTTLWFLSWLFSVKRPEYYITNVSLLFSSLPD